MRALQYIYTSWRNGGAAEKGYMIYSKSEGITPQECTAIKDTMQYAVPKELPPAPSPSQIAEEFPFSFAYFVLPSGRGCVAQATYLGRDYSGRYGNYIIYALVLEADELPILPASLFAEPFMKTAMTQAELDAPSPVPPLPPLEITTWGSAVNDDQLLDFLDSREEDFAQLITMVLAAKDAGIPFYLNDTRENLVLWAAAMQRILPDRLALGFGFNTYMGDQEACRSPRLRDQGIRLHLVGVRPDANFFHYELECQSRRHLVMDLLGGHRSPMPASPFARDLAASAQLGFDDADRFGAFVDHSGLREFGGSLADAWKCWLLLELGSFDGTADSLRAILRFASQWLPGEVQSAAAAQLLEQLREDDTCLLPDTLAALWSFARDGSFTPDLLRVATSALLRLIRAGEAACTALDTALSEMEKADPARYDTLLAHVLGPAAAPIGEQLADCEEADCLLFLLRWLTRKPIAPEPGKLRLPEYLIQKLTRLPDTDQGLTEILVRHAGNAPFFRTLLGLLGRTAKDAPRGSALGACLRKAVLARPEQSPEAMERNLLTAPDAGTIAAGYFVSCIREARKPEEEFRRICGLHGRLGSTMALDGPVLACLRFAQPSESDPLPAEILTRVDPKLLKSPKVIAALTDRLDRLPLKALHRQELNVLKRASQLRARTEPGALTRVRAVYAGRLLEQESGALHPTVSLSGDLAAMDLGIGQLSTEDYGTYLELYLEHYFDLIRKPEDLPALFAILENPNVPDRLPEEFCSSLRKLERREPNRHQRLLGWACCFVLERPGEPGCAALRQGLLRIVRGIPEAQLDALRAMTAKAAPPAACADFFRDAEQKGSFFGSLLRRK